MNNSELKKKFTFIRESKLQKEYVELSRWQLSQLRQKLPKGVYWLQITTGGIVQWNVELLLDYIVNGDSDGHQKLVEEFLSSLPKPN
jgi:hypothetical protein